MVPTSEPGADPRGGEAGEHLPYSSPGHSVIPNTGSPAAERKPVTLAQPPPAPSIFLSLGKEWKRKKKVLNPQNRAWAALSNKQVTSFRPCYFSTYEMRSLTNPEILSLFHPFFLPFACCDGSFISQLDWATRCPDIWSNVISRYVCEDASGREPPVHQQAE